MFEPGDRIRRITAFGTNPWNNLKIYLKVDDKVILTVKDVHNTHNHISIVEYPKESFYIKNFKLVSIGKSIDDFI